jgi:hypothetical protein
MKQDPFLQLIDTSSSFPTAIFLQNIGLVAMASPDPQAVLNRFMVRGLAHCKAIEAATDMISDPHIILIELEDTNQKHSDPIFIVLERATSIVRSQPLLPNSFPSSDRLSKDKFELNPSSPPAISSYQLPLFAPATQSTPNVYYRADDHFIGSKNIGAYKNSALNLREIRPNSLTVFDLAIIADAICSHYPYHSRSILKHQSFWFASTICDVVREYDYAKVNSEAHSVSKDVCDLFPLDMAFKSQKYREEKENEV